MSLKVLGIAGSLRSKSYNRYVLHEALQYAEGLGANTSELSSDDLMIPLYDADLEKRGIPSEVGQIRELVANTDVLLIASPEYNYSITGVLKNLIDWLSTPSNVLDGQVAAIFGTSSGGFGTVRGQNHLRDVLSALNVFMLPLPQVYVSYNQKAFDENGRLVDVKTSQRLKELVEKTLKFATAVSKLKFD